jgi:hypothetical protein
MDEIRRDTTRVLGEEAVAARDVAAEEDGYQNETPPLPSTDERERGRKAIRLLDEWMADESGHDEEYWPKLKAVLEQDRLSSRPPFDEDSH